MAGFVWPGYYDPWLVKVDSFGNHEWNETYGGDYRDEFWSVVETFDGGYAVTGYTNSFTGSDDDFYLVKVDSSARARIWFNSRRYQASYQQVCITGSIYWFSLNDLNHSNCSSLHQAYKAQKRKSSTHWR